MTSYHSEFQRISRKNTYINVYKFGNKVLEKFSKYNWMNLVTRRRLVGSSKKKWSAILEKSKDPKETKREERVEDVNKTSTSTSIPANEEATTNKENQNEIMGLMARFMLTTTMHGFLRIINTQYKLVRFMWIGFFIFAIIGLIVNFIYLSIYFANRSKDTTIGTSEVSFPIPDVTVCTPSNWFDNICFVTEPQVRKMYQKLRELSLKYFHPGLDLTDPLNMITTRLLMEREMRTMQPNSAEFINKCNIIKNGINTKSCSYKNFTELYHPFYGTCITTNFGFRPIFQQNDYFDFTYMLLTFHSKFKPILYSQYEVFELQYFNIFIHPPNTYPALNRVPTLRSINSDSLIISLNQHVYKTLSDSGNNSCVLDKDVAGRVYRVIPGHARPPISYNYSQYLCESLTQQNYTLKLCKCLDEKLPVPVELRQHVYCHTIPIDVNETFYENYIQAIIIQNIECLKNASRNFQKEFKEKLSKLCPTKCTFTHYDLNSDQFIQKFPIPDRSGLRKLVIERNSSLVNRPKNRYKCNSYFDFFVQSTRLPGTFHSLYTHIGRIQILPAESPNLLYEDTESISSYQFVSNIGGIFSIFIGMSIISVIEIAELLINVVYTLYMKRK